jgi:hypothetical protein
MNSKKEDDKKLPIVYFHLDVICHECARVTEFILDKPIAFKKELTEWRETIPLCKECKGEQSITSERHICHVDGCFDGFTLKQTCKPPLHFLCLAHARYVRKELTEALQKEKAGSLRRIAVRRRALAEITFLCYGGATAKPYIEDAERWRKIAFVRGEGDPLEMLSKLPPPSKD